MKLKNALSRFHLISSKKENELWDVEMNHSKESLDSISKIYFAEMELLGTDHDKLMFATQAMLEDLNHVQQEEQKNHDGLRFLQFEFAAGIMQILGLKRMFSELFTWTANSLASELEPTIQRILRTGRISEFFLSQNAYIKENLAMVFIRWTGTFFYYQRIKAGFKDVTTYFVDHHFIDLKRFVDLGWYSEELVFALGQIQSWAHNNKMQQIKDDCSHALLSLYTWVPIDQLKSIVLSFCACGAEYTHQSKEQWCNQALTTLKLSAHEPLQVLVSRYDGNSARIAKNFEEILTTVDVYHEYLDSLKLTPQALDFEMSRIFTVCGTLMNTLLASGHVDLAVQFICHFFRILDTEQINASGMMIIQHNTFEGVQYSLEQKVVASETDPLQFSPRIINEMNTFLRTTMEVVDDFEFRTDWDEEEKREVGTPVIDEGLSLEKTLVAHFALDREDVCNIIRSASKYFLYSEFQLPLQGLFVRYVGKALPIVQSFVNPLTARTIKNVLIWEGDCIMSESECLGIEKIFKKRGIEVKRLKWYESGKTEFMAEYGKADYDLVWMSCHGEFDHFYPHNSRLVLFQDQSNTESTVSYQEMSENVYKGEARRLLVLNACDGATTTLANSPRSVGFGSSLVNAKQSLMSHQWPSDLYGGFILGILLSIYLAEQRDYLASYKEAIECFLAGKENVMSKISSYLDDEEILNRIGRADINYQNLYFYGSLTYLE
ncbi:MAG: CHAT domain-containing protein [Chryseobacterium sp.]|nr:MAG: CHAT domain-containing protein [Chryseobacterium sp.]